MSLPLKNIYDCDLETPLPCNQDILDILDGEKKSEALFKCASVCQRLGRFKKAMDFNSEALSSHDCGRSQIAFYLQTGNIFTETKQAHSAINHFLQCIDLCLKHKSDNLIKAYLGLGAAYQKLKNFEEDQKS